MKAQAYHEGMNGMLINRYRTETAADAHWTMGGCLEDKQI